MMLFVSDLDRTIIFSSRFMQSVQEERSYQVVEVVNGTHRSFITETALHLLNKVRSSVMFVPVTTRTREQYERIQLFQGNGIPPYAVVGNGATILRNGKVDQEWHHHIVRRCSQECVSREAVRDKLKESFPKDWLKEERDADGWFFYYIVDQEKTDYEALYSFQKWCSTQGWKATLHGRKFYLIPTPINKGDAVTYIQEKEGQTFSVSAGDSLLDLPMLKATTIAYTAKESDLDVSKEDLPTLRVTEKGGILSAESLLLEVLLLSSSNLDKPEILSSKAACTLWGIDSSTLRKRKGDFPPGTIRKFGSSYAVTVSGMKAVFGSPLPSTSSIERRVTL
ncbi:haloacid dehalogenase [Pontibacillus sp. ALD_SL1]|uniref:helix-turn-helix domain-containing protein n=1 Tax=Pontibacillus sp. ALD_SL1 TaxID=2777185 RepID=UPI001A96E02B|nr:helix-turn-helix domain-containing protein [Pontibacillus sp. ALD_SL1]QSS99302.1 haloacid dehalogenase [Pontibacillus sp. ALD_SL1]